MMSKGKVHLNNKLNDLTANEWIKETVSVFVQRGLGSNHKDTKIERQHPAPFSFQDVGRLINFFTKEGGLVLDPFCGVGSTLKACALNNRRGIGIELVKKYVDLTNERLKTEVGNNFLYNQDQKVILGDALEEIKNFENNTFDFLITSPPYWYILNKVDKKVKENRLSNGLDTKYSNLEKDLGNIKDYDTFLDTLGGFFRQCSRIIKPKKYMSIIVSDFRHKSKFYMFHSDLAREVEEGDFMLKGVVILYQKYKSVYPYGYPYAYVSNIHHQYILIFQNTKQQ